MYWSARLAEHLEFPAVGASENRCQCDDFASLKAVAESS
jgi:hypothetical protein